MADIPKHLLERAAARRAALAGGDAPAPAAPVEAESASVPAVAAPSVPVAAGGGSGAGAPPVVPSPVAPVPAPVPSVPRGMTFARIGSVFMLVAVPVWTFFMFNAFAESASADTPEVIGKALYEANCSSCHAGNGAGSDAGLAGRPLYQGSVEKTFPNPLDQFAFVRHGSCEGGVPYGNPKREGGQHAAKKGMPNFAAATLSDEELIAVINYERYVLNGKTYPGNLLAPAGAPEETVSSIVPEADLVKTLGEVKVTTEDVCG